jgi:putative flippase GtrA
MTVSTVGPRRSAFGIDTGAPRQARKPILTSRSEVSAEAVRFAIVGIIATALSAGVYNSLVHAEARTTSLFTTMPLAAVVVANAIGMVVSYLGTSLWVFRERHSDRLGGLVGFVVVNVISWSIPISTLGFTRYVLGRTDPVADNIAVNVVGLGLGTLARFWLLRRTVFHTQPPGQPAVATSQADRSPTSPSGARSTHATAPSTLPQQFHCVRSATTGAPAPGLHARVNHLGTQVSASAATRPQTRAGLATQAQGVRP